MKWLKKSNDQYNQKILKKLQKKANNDSLKSRDSGYYGLKRLKEKKGDNSTAKYILTTIIYIGLIILVAFILIKIISGEIPVYAYIKNIFAK
jgi:hypothetical protein